jgi:regulator of protease activity HflC (stomatin/prohibitin superfamily)
MYRNLLAAFVIAFAAIFATACNTWVEPGYAGIKVVATGSQKGVDDYPIQTGRVYYNPYNETVLVYPTFVQSVVWTKNPQEGNPVNEEITFTNKDKFPIAVDVNLSYQIKQEKIPAFYVKFRSDDLRTFTNGFMHTVARDTFNEVGGKYGIDAIMGDNAEFLGEVRQKLQTRLTPLGVELVQFGIVGAPRPPSDVANAITASARATQLATQIQNELAQTQAEAMKQVAQAEGAAKARTAQAEAEANANRKIGESISPTLVEYMKIQKWDGKLPTVSGGGTPLINIGKQ